MSATGSETAAGPSPRRAARGWIGEMVMMFGAIVAVDYGLRPAFSLLDATPHPFWLPVLAIALGHGTLRGIVATIIATALGWWHGWPTPPGGLDFYARALLQWKEPALWLAAAFAAGAVREYHARGKDMLGRRADEAEMQRAAIADHAVGLRAYIARLEDAIASAAPAPAPAAAKPGATPEPAASHIVLASLIDEMETPELETRIAAVAREFLGAEVRGFWLHDGFGWQRGWGEAELDRMLPAIESRIGDGAEAISVPHAHADTSPRGRVRIAVPVRDPESGWLGGVILLGAPDARLRGRSALAVAGAMGRVLGEVVFGEDRAPVPTANRSLLTLMVDDG